MKRTFFANVVVSPVQNRYTTCVMQCSSGLLKCKLLILPQTAMNNHKEKVNTTIKSYILPDSPLEYVMVPKIMLTDFPEHVFCERSRETKQ